MRGNNSSTYSPTASVRSNIYSKLGQNQNDERNGHEGAEWGEARNGDEGAEWGEEARNGEGTSSDGDTSSPPPLERRNSQAQTSTRIATVIFFKGLFGAGVLAIPHAFQSTGLVLGVICFGLVSLVCLGTMLILLECQKIIREQKGICIDCYEDLAGEVFGPRGFRIVQIIMSGLTLIYCTAFVIVISSSLHNVFPNVTREVWCFIVLPILLALSWLPFMKDLWIASIFGLLTYLIGVIGTTLYYSSAYYQAHPETMQLRWSGLPHFFGIAIYALEGINLTLPVASSMKSIRKPPVVMTLGVIGFSIITVVYSAYAYAAGLGSCDIIVECLGQGKVVVVVRLALALSLIATHPVYLIVASEIFEKAILGEVAAEAESESFSYTNKARLIRAIEVAFTCLVASVVPSLSKFTALVGSSAVCLIGFIIPFAMWLTLLDSQTTNFWTRVRAYCISGVVMVVGLLAMMIGTSEGIRDLVMESLLHCFFLSFVIGSDHVREKEP